MCYIFHLVVIGVRLLFHDSGVYSIVPQFHECKWCSCIGYIHLMASVDPTVVRI